jgi:hypothetical protein
MGKGMLALLLVPAIGAMPVSAAQPPSTAPVPTVKTNPLDKMVCRTDEASGGRLNRRRICMTVREWQEQAQESREATELLQRQGQGKVF